MICKADFISKKLNETLYQFRINTRLISEEGENPVIGLIYMYNPGSARPSEKNLKVKFNKEECILKNCVTTDPTLNRITNLLDCLQKKQILLFPKKFTIHIENLFNICDSNQYDSYDSIRLLKKYNDLIYYSREFGKYDYKFVWIAWGKTDKFLKRREKIIQLFPDAIKVNKYNYRGRIINIDHPHHPLYLGENLFIDAVKTFFKKN